MPATPAPALALDQRLAHRLGMAGRLVRTLADAELSDLGIGAPALGVLLRLMEEDGLTQAEIARRQRVEAPTMCRMVDRLARDGFVERLPDSSDRRATRVRLTAKGSAAAERGTAVVEAIELRAFAGLDAAERRQLTDLLARVIERIPPSGGAPS